MANPFWPSVDTMDEAKKACHTAGGFSFFVAIVTAVVVYLQTSGKINIVQGFSSWAYIDAGLFFLIGLGLMWCSRIAAVIGLILFVAERIFMIQQTGMSANLIMPIIITLGFIGGVRGSFSYHVFRKLEKEEGRIDEAAAAPAEETAPKNKFRKILFITGLSLLGVAGLIFAAAYFLLPRSSSPGAASYSSSGPASTGADAIPGEPVASGEEMVFRLKTGETVKGRVVREDETYYTVETFGGGQQYVIKEDIAK